jgi:hypothetical protein
MEPMEALRHEKGKRHRQSRNTALRADLGQRGMTLVENCRWGPKVGLDALENRKFEGSLGTMQTRVMSWMKGLRLAAEEIDGKADASWKMEEDYQVEEYPPLEEWSSGWGETWALSSTSSSKSKPSMPVLSRKEDGLGT